MIMTTSRTALRRNTVLAAVCTMTLALMTVVLAQPAYAAVSPVVQRATTGMTADALPTVQIDGVVWSQAIVGNTVYAGGSFANARPAGAAPGTNETPRANLLSYSLTTGALNTDFAPHLNGQVKSVVASPDGTRVYVGGSFTTANGQNRNRLAAYSTSTGQLVSSFQPVLDATVNSLTVTNTTVYAGGIFGNANGVRRQHLAAFSAGTGALLGWAPPTDSIVQAVQLTPDGSRVIVAGSFQKVNGARALGMASVSATTGATQQWSINRVVKDYGSQGAILSLSTDGTSIYGTGYDYGDPSNFEGAFSADPTTGAINWLADCHGDSYGAFASAAQVYVVSHEHYCANIGAFTDTRATTQWQRSTAFTVKATGTVLTNGQIGGGYGNFAGQPSPSMVNWYPNIDIGTYTGNSQGAWTVTGNSTYVVEGGEFQHVNGTAQQGIVRFAVPSVAPGKIGPQDYTSAIDPTVVPDSNTTASVTWLTNWDEDDQVLSYSVFRDDNLSTPVYRTTATSQFWNRPTLTYEDTGLIPGKKYIYWVTATDPDGNTQRSANVTITAPNNGPVASFTSQCTDLSCAFDASGSTDVGGTITGYAWTFGDDATGDGAGRTHAYAAAGTYPVTLTVTDSNGLVSKTTKSLTVNAAAPAPPPGVYATDTFARTSAAGWGTADTGGSWDVSDASQFAVANGVGTMRLDAPGAAPIADLPGVTATNEVQTVDVSADAAATGNGYFLALHGRASSSSNYQLKLRMLAGGAVHLVLSKVVAGSETVYNEVNVAGVTATAGARLRVQFSITTSGAAASLAGTVWNPQSTQPASPQISQLDSSSPLGSGGVEMQGYLTGSSTSPVTLSVDNYSVKAPA